MKAVCLILAALFYGSHLPEALLPGKFDILGSSHQLFHVFVYLNMHFGAKAAFGHLGRLGAEGAARRPASLATLLWPIIAVVIAEAAMIGALYRLSPLHPSKAKKRP